MTGRVCHVKLKIKKGFLTSLATTLSNQTFKFRFKKRNTDAELLVEERISFTYEPERYILIA